MIKWVHEELEKWGGWVRAGGLAEVRGYPSQSPFLREAAQTSRRLDYSPTERTPEDYVRLTAYVDRLHPEAVKVCCIRLYSAHMGNQRRCAAEMLRDEKTIRNWRDEAHRQIARFWELDNPRGNPHKGS